MEVQGMKDAVLQFAGNHTYVIIAALVVIVIIVILAFSSKCQKFVTRKKSAIASIESKLDSLIKSIHNKQKRLN